VLTASKGTKLRFAPRYVLNSHPQTTPALCPRNDHELIQFMPSIESRSHGSEATVTDASHKFFRELKTTD